MDFILHLSSGVRGKFSVVGWVVQWLSLTYCHVAIHRDHTELPPVASEAACLLLALPAVCVVRLLAQGRMSDKCCLGIVSVCVCLIVDHVVADHFWEVIFTDKVILFVLSLFSPLPPHCVNIFCLPTLQNSQYTIGLPNFSWILAFHGVQKFFSWPYQVKGCLQWLETQQAL